MQDASSPEELSGWAAVLLRSDAHELAAILVDASQTVVATNGAAAALLDRNVVGEPLLESFEPGSRIKLARALETGGTCELLLRGSENDAPRVVRFAVLPEAGARRVLVGASNGQIWYSEAQGRELLRRNDELGVLSRQLARQAQELGQARTRLEHLNALRQQLTATLAHDLRNPLSAVGLVARELGRLGQGLPLTRVSALARRLERSVLRMARLIDTVLAAVRLEEDEIALDRTSTSLEDVVREAIDALAPLADERHVSVACAARGDTRALVDATWMGQVLDNLLANAIRHAPQGSAVRVAISGDEQHVECSVSDQGPGVPPELREAIFDRFRQAGPHAGSAGLGLYVSRGVLELHGGRIWVEQPETGGARFCFEVPRATP